MMTGEVVDLQAARAVAREAAEDPGLEHALAVIEAIRQGGVMAAPLPVVDANIATTFLLGVSIGEHAVRERFLLAMSELGMSRDAIGEILAV
jgi:hypothetical protein